MNTEITAKTSIRSPACYHGALEYFSSITGISKQKKLSFTDLEQLRHKKKLKYKASDIAVVDTTGDTHPYMLEQLRYDSRGIEAAMFIVSVNRPLEEFGIEYKAVGNYRDDLGGGWHSNTPLYEYSGFYFAYMECSCY